MAVIALNKENFKAEVLQSDKPVLVDFWATWCGPCRMMAPVVESIAEEHPELKVMSIPTLAAFKDGQLSGTAVGYQPKENVLKLFA